MKNSMVVKTLTLAALGFSAITAHAQVVDQSSEKLPAVYVVTAPLSTVSMQPAGCVLKVKLDTKLQSNVARKGDPFTATLDMGKSRDYFGLPAGTKVEGHVTDVRAREGKLPGMLTLQPDTILLTNGTRYPISATFMKIEKKSVTKENGRLMATPAYQSGSMNYIVTGAAVGVGLAALSGGDLLAGGLLGAAIGFFIGQSHGNTSAHDVTLKPGTVMGVRLDKDTPIEVAIN